MGGENRMLKRKSRFHRWLAMALTVALLAGQSHVFVLAEEGDVPPIETSDETATGVSDNDNTGDNDSDTDRDEENTEDPQEGEDTLAEEVDEEETVSGNALDEEAGIVVLAEDDVKVFEDSNGIKYRVIDDDQVEVIGQKDGCSVSGELAIPKTVTNKKDTYQVTRIAYHAFFDYGGLTSVTIPNSVTSIGGGAFWGCSLTSIEIPESVTEIGAGAFGSCASLTSVTIPKSITRLEGVIFADCTSLTNVEIPDGVTSIGNFAFGGCSSLTNVEIPESVTNIGDDAFASCGFSNIKIPESVTSIGVGAFNGCPNLVSVEIPEGVTSIEDSLFAYCYSLASIKIPKDVTSIGASAFSNCKSLTGIEIPTSVTSIGRGAFFYCSGLSSIKIPKGVPSIEESTFSFCSSLDSIEIPNSVTSIGGAAFRDCTELSTIAIPNGVTKIGDGAFYMCEKLEEMQIVVPSGETPQLPEVRIGASTFAFISPNENYVIFVDENGIGLTGTAFEEAQSLFSEAEKRDGFNDGRWFGWLLKEASEIKDAYTVIIHVNKDGQEWSDHGRTFALLPNGGGSFITDLTQVPNGDYRIYDLTGVNPDSYFSKAVDVGVSVTVKDGDTGVAVTVDGSNPEEKNVDYYTVTFYDDATPYGEETPQRPQIVLNGKTAAKPANPEKTDYQFTGWKTANGGSMSYDFEHDNMDQAVPKITSIYASWKPEGGNSGGGSDDGGNDDGGDSGSGDEDGGDSGNGSEAGGNSPAGSNRDGIVSGGGAERVQNKVSADHSKSAGHKEPKTGDASHAEVYATVAMIAGLTYLLLYFMEEGRGMSEREKEVFVSAFIRWAKKGGTFRRCCAIAAIFCLLAYYHSIGKRTGRDALNEKYLGQVS